jgi:pyridoxamine 5'-phosphate oxidase
MKFGDLRRDYAGAPFDVADAAPDPLDQFRAWFADAAAANVPEPNAMTLATADRSGRPNARIVLLKDVDDRGFVFFTDHRSPKGRELEVNPQAALVFRWHELERQVRVVGTVERVSIAVSEAYFRTRPLGSRLGAWASEQSAGLDDRATLERAVERVATRFADGDVPLPPHWGGYRVIPDEMEFWQGRESRLHDRVQYMRGDGGWRRTRLSP